VPDLGLLDPEFNKTRPTGLRYQLLDATEPTITLPVTGNRTVQIALDGGNSDCGISAA